MDVAPIIRKDFLIISKDSTVGEMIGQLKRSNKRFGLVFAGNKYIGIMERKNLLKTRIDTAVAKLSKHLTKAPLLNEHADIIETAYLLYKSNLDFIPVESKGKIIGVIEAKDLASLALLLPEAKNFIVQDLSIAKPESLQKNDPVAKALTIMFNESIDQVPIFDQERLYGVISYRDLLKKYLIWPPKREFSRKLCKESGGTRGSEPDHPHLAQLPVSTFSTNDNLITTSLKEPLKDLMKRLQSDNVTCAVLQEENQPQGLITVKNILRAIASLNIPKNFNLQFIGLSKLNLDDYDKTSIKKIAANEAFKLQRNLPERDFSLVIHIKDYNKRGNQHKYSVHLRVESPGETFAVDQFDWDIRRAFHKAFANAKNKLGHDLKRQRNK